MLGNITVEEEKNGIKINYWWYNKNEKLLHYKNVYKKEEEIDR